ncbi:MAG: FAD-dependent oxidoreductase [Deltaproteobacteria bacterium]|nr:MAG: FAD-dependent oxidoreductase [Deltaproteobacteria bacterium]
MAFDYLVVATGANPRPAGVQGEDLEGIFSLRNLADAIRIKTYIQARKVKKAVIVGAGFVSLEMCEAFRGLNLETTVVYRKELPMSKMGFEFGRKILAELEANGVHFMGNTEVRGFDRTSSGGLVIQTTNGPLETDLVLVALGVVPEVDLAKQSGIALGPTGAIAVDDQMRTSVPSIYSAGDCCECFHRISRKPTYLPLGDTANKQGRIAGANIGGQELSFPGVVGSICLKVFGLEVASTGLSPEEAAEVGLEATSVTVQGSSRARSYPSSGELWLRLVADAQQARLLGAQAVGSDGVVARINALAVALTGGLGLDQLAYVDLAYAPPFSGAWDPIHIAAQQLLK